MTLGVDEKISKPGVYELPMSVYHSDCCAGFSISGSGLVLLEEECPAKFWWQSWLNPDRPEDSDTKATAFGSLVHCLLLDGVDAFKAQYVVRPEGLTFTTKEGKAWRDAQTAKIVASDEYETAIRMVEAISKHSMARNVFQDGLAERSLIWKDPITGIWLKNRPDWLPNSSPYVPNFKTGMSARPSKWKKQAYDLGYHQSAALTQDAMMSIFGRETVPYFVVVEKEPPFVVSVFMLKDTDIDWARRLNRRALDTLARCLETGNWPGYVESVAEVWMPGWMEFDLQKRHEAGDFYQAEMNLSRLSDKPSPDLVQEPV